MKERKSSLRMIRKEKGVWGTLYSTMANYARKCRHSYLSMLSI
ncbi:hypothetical protein [Muriicola sp.]